jgi:hypothetical protein
MALFTELTFAYGRWPLTTRHKACHSCAWSNLVLASRVVVGYTRPVHGLQRSQVAEYILCICCFKTCDLWSEHDMTLLAQGTDFGLLWTLSSDGRFLNWSQSSRSCVPHFPSLFLSHMIGSHGKTEYMLHLPHCLRSTVQCMPGYEVWSERMLIGLQS